jgi:hypothetical protein
VKSNDVGIIVFAIHNIPLHERRQVLEICAATPARVVTMPDIIGTLKSVVSSPDSVEAQDYQLSQVEDLIPCQYCLQRGTHQVYDTWFANIDELVRSGDIQTARLKIQSYREKIQAETRESDPNN